MTYRIAPPGWTHTSANPFTADGSYGPCWSAFCLQDRDDDQFITGQAGDGPFSARFGRGVKGLERRLADFLRYEQSHGRTVILSFPPGMDVDQVVSRALGCTPGPGVVRAEDPTVLVHATTRAAWRHIQADGELRAASLLAARRQLPREPGRLNPVEEYLRHEPPEYPDYIMFGEMETYGPEMVVAAYQAGQFVYDADAIFEPGVRLYFDNHRILQDGLGVRDGLHAMKVHLRLPLQPYLIAAVGGEDIDPRGAVERWTIRHFVERANEIFRSQR